MAYEVQYTNMPSDAFTATKPKLSNTPCQALSSKHFIIALIINLIATFWINFGLAHLFLKGSDRVGLWKTYKYVFVDETRVTYADTKIVIDFIFTSLLVGFCCSLLGHGGIQGAVSRGEAFPIARREYKKVLKYFGITIKSIWLRSLVFAVIGFVCTYFFFLIGMKSTCDNGHWNMHFDETTEKKECYMTKGKYCWYKAGFATVVCLVIFPFIELAGLNKDLLSEEQYQGFLEKKGYSMNTSESQV